MTALPLYGECLLSLLIYSTCQKIFNFLVWFTIVMYYTPLIFCEFWWVLLDKYLKTCVQETANKELSTLAKATFELLKWRTLPRPFLENAVSVILSSMNDPNWRTRSASLSYLRTFMYRLDFFCFFLLFSIG